MQANLCDSFMPSRVASDHLLRRYMFESGIAICAPKLVEPGELLLSVLGLPVCVDSVLVVVTNTHVDASGG